ncbi:MAG: bifunctional DNA-formamidopyrimidine glycosylase/DNA-(apurinic or apyrimidinic site) lyase [Gemmatimonadota bacterium]|nr:bifunctional DNA-formamidopyrimidine glycosylase/DNA-(apurinic or apyrimidinic site) lyase [Gemmatimonadota bacterium]
MPELPEVERAARALERASRGKVIAAVRALHPSFKRSLPPANARRARGLRVVRIERRGKHQLIHLDDGSVLHAHFRMTGDWSFGKVTDDIDPRARAVIDLENGTRVSLIDPRALASLMLHRPGEEFLPDLGPEPLDASFTAEALRAALAKRRGPIKPALLDQSVVAGIGNIYAAESLWESRIDPRAQASSLGEQRLRALVRAIRAVLRRARPGDGRYFTGSAQANWRVYDREGLACSRCDGTIERITQATRSTYFCPGCQVELS